MKSIADRTPAGNTGLAKVAVQCSADTFTFGAAYSVWLIKVWFSASTFVVKIATFAKPENVMGKFKKRQRHSGQTREPPKFYFDSS
jgi:hypothetical protein